MFLSSCDDYMNNKDNIKGIYSTGLLEIKARLGDILNTDNWNLLEESVVLDILDDQKLKVKSNFFYSYM